MKLSYNDPETEKLKKKQLIEYVIGVKPETKIGKVTVDGLYPASQFHFSLEERISADQEERLNIALEIGGSGLVQIEIFANRIILTTTCPAKEREVWSGKFAEVINGVLDS